MNLGFAADTDNDADAADDEADHALLRLLDLVALPPIPSLQLKVGHPGGWRQCHQDEMMKENLAGSFLLSGSTFSWLSTVSSKLGWSLSGWSKGKIW